MLTLSILPAWQASQAGVSLEEALTSPDLVLEKTASVPVAAVGEFFTYSLKVTNQGTVDSGPLLLEDPLPAGVQLSPNGGSGPPPGVTCRTQNQGRKLQCSKPSLASLSSFEVSFRVQVSGDAFGLKSNLAEVLTEGEDVALLENNCARVDVTLVPTTDLNRDGRLDGKDAAHLVFELNDGDGDSASDVAGGSFPGTIDFDVNSDGRINQDDVFELARSILFRIDTAGSSTADLSLLIPTGNDPAGSTLDFPRLGFEPGKLTGMAIVNPNTAPAAVTLTAYSDLGEELAIAQRTIEPGQQLSQLTFELFGQLDPSTRGWFQATSPVPDLTGFFLDLDGSLSELDGADLPERANEIVFNTVNIDDGFSTELNIVNPNPTPLTATLKWADTGSAPLSASLEISGMGSIRTDVRDLFNLGSPAGASSIRAGYIRVEASTEILGFQVIRGGTRDFQGLNARNSLEFLNKIYIPQMAVLGVFESELGVVNYSANPVLATVSAFDPLGELYVSQVQQNPVVLSLGPGEAMTRDLADLFGFQGNETLQGWLEIASSSQGINGYFSYRIPATGAQAAISAVADATSAGLFSHLATVPGFFTGVAALNTAAFPADYRIVALSKEGEVFGSFSGVLRPRQRISELISDLIPNAAGQNGGIIFVRSSVPLFLNSLFGTDDISVLANIPPQMAPIGFAPDSGIVATRVSPALNVLQPGGTQNFALPGVTGDVQWTVNGIEGGSLLDGLITSRGSYTAPAAQPRQLPVTIVGDADGISSSASIDVVEAGALREGLGEVLSVAFLSNLGLLYTAELSISAAGATPQTPAGSAIFAMTPDSREELGGFSGEIVQIIPFSARNSKEYLLLVDATFGSVIRFDPETADSRDVLTGLDEPSAATLDPITGDLLIADSNQISIVSRFALEEDLVPQNFPAWEDPRAAQPKLDGVQAPIAGIRGIAVDLCTGLIYLSQPTQGKVISLDRSTQAVEDVVVGLDQPFRLRGLYREGVRCPEAFHLFIVERGRRRLDLYIPSEDKLAAPWLEAEQASDLVLLPPLTRFREERSLVVSRRRQGKQVLSAVNVESVYRPIPVNPPPNLRPGDRAPAPGPDLVVGVKSVGKDRLTHLPLQFRPGPDDGRPGGADESLLLMFSLDIDEKRLSFDPTDGDEDGIPDSIQLNLPEDYLLIFFYDPALKNRELAFLIIDIEAPFRPLPEGSNISIQFRTSDRRSGTAVVGFRGPPPQIVDVQGNPQVFDQILNGGIRIQE